jgi:predicted dehydrogenase
MLKAAIIGYGGISAAHEKGYMRLEADGLVKLCAACDVREDAFDTRKKINIEEGSSLAKTNFKRYTDLDEMLANEELDFVDICVPSYLHKEISIKVLDKGINVLCEKPMALSSADCDEMLEAEKRSGKHFMIAQVLRFAPEYEFLKECIDDGRYGKVLTAFFERNSAQPLWGFENWYLDYNRCGGGITDIHIHDVDMVRYLFGEPDAVSCRASDCHTRYDFIHTDLYYGKTRITAHGGWSGARIKFAASYKVDFEKATVIYEGAKVTVYPIDEKDEPFTPKFSGYTWYTGEIAFFCDIIEGRVVNTKNPASSAANTVRLIEAMKRSADMGGEKIKFS